jgi:hypothetical protein
MQTSIVLLLSAVCALAACDKSTPAEVRDHADTFPQTATWNATAAPVGTNTVGATLTVKQYLGFRMEASVTLTGGVANRGYQWRIFRGDCATTAVASANTSPTGLLLFATTQSYPDIVADASGRGTSTPIVAGSLDPQTAYSVRFRVTQSATNWNGTSPIACGNLQRSGA